MNRRGRLGFRGETIDNQKHPARFSGTGMAARIAIGLLLTMVTVTGCSLSRSKKATNGDESHFLASCQPECGADLECICGVCTKVCENDDDCEELPSATCVRSELLEAARHCEPTDPVEASVCDIGCSDDNACIELDEDATCESGYCRPPEIEKLIPVLDASVLDDAAADDIGSTESPGGRDAGETGDTSETDSADLYSDDPEDEERRLTLVGQFCSLIETYPCLDWDTFFFNNGISANSSLEQQIDDCEVAIELEYRYGTRFCSGLWEEVIRCHIQRDYSCPCSEDLSRSDCYAPSINSGGPGDPCYDELEAFLACRTEFNPVYSNERFTGDRGTCDIDLIPMDPGDCEIDCSIDSDGTIVYGADCDGPPNGPLECTCTVVDTTLIDIRRNYFVYGNDCAEVAQALADGRCIEILDCCFTWADENNAQRCGCTSDLRAASILPSGIDPGITTCADLAGRVNGEVVDLCPAYEEPPTDPFL